MGAAAVLAASWVVVEAAEKVPPWEEWAFRRVNDLPDVVWPVAWAPMQLGSLAGSLCVVVVASAVSGDRRLRWAALGASQAGWWAAKLVKVLVSRARPGGLLPDVHLREDARGRGYLSGHSAVAFALASVVAPTLPRRWQAGPFAAATGVAFARVYAGAHLPIDVVGGAGLGVLLGTSARWVAGLGGAGVPPR